MFALLAAVLAVYLWDRYKYGFLPAMLAVAVSLAIYQSYIAVTITLLILVLIMEISKGADFGGVMKKSLKGIAMLGGAGVTYIAALLVARSVTDQALNSTASNSLYKLLSISPRQLPIFILRAYYNAAQKLISVPSHDFSVIVKKLLLFTALLAVAVMVIKALLGRKLDTRQKILLVALNILLPLGMNITYVLSMCVDNDIAAYAIWLVYLYSIIAVQNITEDDRSVGTPLKYITAAAIAFILLLNVQFSNAVYVEKELMFNSTFAYMDRVVCRIEELDGYVPGETPVVMVGELEQLDRTIFSFGDYHKVTGLHRNDSVSDYSRRFFAAYFTYILNYPINLVDQQTWQDFSADERTGQMPCFPDDDSIAMIDDILVVRLG